MPRFRYRNRREVYDKWDNVANQITTVSFTNAQAGDFVVGTRIEVWGSRLDNIHDLIES